MHLVDIKKISSTFISIIPVYNELPHRQARRDLYLHFLSSYFKEHVDGLGLSQKAVYSHIKEVIDIANILLKGNAFDS